ncbi:PEP-CTERM/exosortase system-associated acyltransferase [Billgrantia azerbaijanica]|nr:PEP-CTERM/exosortase system-associated acyltransferase [Halomonas azerbaijanica]
MTPGTPRIGCDTPTRLFECFRHEFRFQLADTPALRRRVFRLRHDVYCRELGYEKPADAAARLEFDTFDDEAILCLLSHNDSDSDAGCLRLVLPRPTGPDAACRLPLQGYAGQSLIHPTLHPGRLPHDTLCEISRLAIAPGFRRRPRRLAATTPPDTALPFSEAQRRTFPAILVGLFLASTALVGLVERPHVFAMMEARLPRLLARSGLNFARVGETIDFHGRRSAYYIDQRCAEQEMVEALRPLYRHIQQTLAPQLSRALNDAALTAPSGIG